MKAVSLLILWFFFFPAPLEEDNHSINPLNTFDEHFLECIAGEGIFPDLDCVIYDIEGDDDIDIRDFALRLRVKFE